MLRYRTGDILAADAEALVNTVNCVGVMGRGIALQFKRAFPENFKAYEAACRRGELEPGRMFVFETGELGNPRYIINFPTKRHWRGKSRVADIDAGLAALCDELRHRGIRSVAMPPLGTGLGGLNWSDVRARIEATVGQLEETDVLVFAPNGAPAADRMVRPAAPAMTPGRAALIGLMDRYLRGVLDPFVTLVEVHKLMYFMQEAGEPLKLRYREAQYGPYAENLRHVLKAVDGHMVTGYADGGDAPDKELHIVPGVAADAEAYLQDHPVTRAHFDRVVDLVTGFETPLGMELLATVHWVATRRRVADFESLARTVHQWNARKADFSRRQIATAYRTLVEKGWLEPMES